MSAPTRDLRDLTLAEHRALERTALARGLLAPDLNPSRYRALLAGWLQAWEPLERALARAPDARALGELLPAPRSAVGRADLAWLDARLPDKGLVDGGQPSATALTWPPPQPAQGVAAALGWAYVLRGSTLGGQLIARQLLQRLGPDLAPAVRFFAAAEPQGLSWPRWQQAADARLADPADLQAAAQAARSAFVWLAGRFDATAPASTRISDGSTLGMATGQVPATNA